MLEIRNLINSLEYRETTVNRIKTYMSIISEKYLNYEFIKINLKVYPNDTISIIEDIIRMYKSIKFSKIFTLFNFLTLVENILVYIINKLQSIKDYDILKGVERVLFYLEYFIYKYYYKYNEFHFIYLCRYSPTYYSLCLKHFLKLEYKKNVGSQFSYILIIFSVWFLTWPITYAVLNDLEKYNSVDNVYHFIISSVAPC